MERKDLMGHFSRMGMNALEFRRCRQICISLMLFLLMARFTPDVATAQDSWETPFEQSGGIASSSYEEGIAYCRKLADTFSSIHMMKTGTTDRGLPLHLVVFDTDGFTGLTRLSQTKKLKVLVMNAIHPGEPAGVDASLMLLRDLAMKRTLQEFQEDFVFMIIPFYNVGGALNRGSHSRANQVGPEAYGFRGNARNLDLNRDFIKMDSKNTRSFSSLFHFLDPDLFIDTHTTNGADYAYALTFIETQTDRLGGALGPFVRDELSPLITTEMNKKGMDIVHYVNVFGNAPDENGYHQFMDYPRYSTGFTALFQTIGYVTEAHMLKPFRQRVSYTREFLETLLREGSRKREKIRSLRLKDRQFFMELDTYPLHWDLDTNKADSLTFMGYETYTAISPVTGHEMMKYDRKKPYQKQIPFFRTYQPGNDISLPEAYIIPQAWERVIEQLELNEINMIRFERDTLVEVEVYYIENYGTYERPWEGHYAHYNTKVRPARSEQVFLKGDFFIPCRQPGIRYLLEVLEPAAPDSFFNWNFFDSILARKEYFSTYVFDQTADSLIQAQPWLGDSLAIMRDRDPDFRESHRAQLNYIYQNSVYYEKEHLRYPVYRVVSDGP